MSKRKPQNSVPDEQPNQGFRPLSPHLRKLIDLLPLDQPVHRSEIEASYQRPNYARRIRKIIDEYGWDIKIWRGSNGPNDDWYERKSDGPVRPQKIRYEVPRKQRLSIYERDKWKCLMRGSSVHPETGEAAPQCDHKVPSTRGGSSKAVNLQTLCIRCNLKKRQACKLCTLTTCDNCPYAFPERFDQTYVVPLPGTTADKLIRLAVKAGIPPAVLIQRLIDAL